MTLVTGKKRHVSRAKQAVTVLSIQRMKPPETWTGMPKRISKRQLFLLPTNGTRRHSRMRKGRNEEESHLSGWMFMVSVR
jgi:hypothetical protein